MKIQHTHIAYLKSRDLIGSASIDPVTRRPGGFVDRTTEALLATSAWVLRSPLRKNLVDDLPPVLRWIKKLLPGEQCVSRATRSTIFQDGVRVEFTVKVFQRRIS